ncbi:MAG: hypothetical protein IT379_03810 [Deltaproteobacteria bacterium]|nr:hypothetical protein [Deltaproteobacteria bacterium]
MALPWVAVLLLVAACDDAAVTNVADLGGPRPGDGAVEPDAAPSIDGATDDTSPIDSGPVDAGIDGAREASVVDAGADTGPFVPSSPVAPAEAAVASPPVVGWLPDLGEGAVAAAAPPRVLEPCPASWRRVAPAPPDDPVAACDPWPASGEETACVAGSVHLPGGAGCAPVGIACPAGDWPDASAITGTRRYVRAGVAPGGDGTSEATPMSRIADALATPRTGRLVVVIASGTYAETLALGADDVVLVGACAARTRIAGAAGAAGGPSVSVSTGAAAVGLRELTVAGIEATGGAALTLDAVVVDGTTIADGAALLVSGGSLVANGLHVVGGPVGVALRAGATSTIDAAVIEDAGGSGIELRGAGTSLVLSRAALRDTVGAGIDDGGAAGTGGRVEVHELVVERATGAALVAAGDAAVIEGADAIVRDTRAVGTTGGAGLAVERGGRIALDRVRVEQSRAVGVDCTGGSLTLRGALVRDTTPRLDRTDGIGVRASLGCDATLERVVVTRASTAGIRVESEGTTLDATDVVVRDVRTTSSAAVSPALDVRGGTVDGRALVLGNAVGRAVRVLTEPADAAPTTVSLHDVVMSGPSGAASDAPAALEVAVGRVLVERVLLRATTGDGFVATVEPPDAMGASLVLADARLEGGGMGIRSGVRADGVGVVVDLHRVTSIGFQSGITSRGGATAHAEDLVIEGRWGVRAIDQSIVAVSRATVSGYEVAGVLAGDVNSRVTGSDVTVGAPSDGADPGAGIVAVSGGAIDLDRVRVEGARGLGAGAYGIRSSAVLRDVVVEATHLDAMGASASAGGYGGGVVTLVRFAASNGALCGVQVADEGGADLDDGQIRGHPVGACMPAGGFDESRVTDRALYVENDASLSRDARAVPVEPSRGP